MSNPFDNLESLSQPSAPSPKVENDGEPAKRKHERYHLGIIQGDRLGGDFEQTIGPARYGLSKFHAALIAGKTKDDIIAEVESALEDLFPQEPTKKSQLATHRYLRVSALLLAAQRGGHTEESAIMALLEGPSQE